MSHIKLVLADLDGTVVMPEAETASNTVITAIAEAKERGITFAAVTGRPWWMAKKLLQSIGFDGLSAVEGGAMIINPATGETVWSKSVPAATAQKAVSILFDLAFLIEYGTGVKTGNEADPTDISTPVLSVWASVPVEKADGLVDVLKKLPEVAVHANHAPAGDITRTGIQVTHVHADKEHAVAQLLTLLDMDKAHTLAIGDGNNDLPLFRAAGVKVAMGNASELLKTQADHVVAPVTADGFAEAIRQYAR